MAAPIFQRTVVDTQGNVVSGATVEIRNEATDELAPVFVDRELTDVKPNPFTTDDTGFIRFFAGAGDYRIKATFADEEIIFRFVQLIDTDDLVKLDESQALTNKQISTSSITASVLNDVTVGAQTPSTGVFTDLSYDTLTGGLSIATQFQATGTGANTLPNGTTAQRPESPVSAMLRFNSQTGQFEGYNGVEWGAIGGGGGAAASGFDDFLLMGA